MFLWNYLQPKPKIDRVMDFLSDDNVDDLLLESPCSKEVLALILSFAGPQTMWAVHNTSRPWRSLLEDEDDVLWRGICQNLYKSKPGDYLPAGTSSWKKYYQYTPCVPIDYSSIDKALLSVSSHVTLKIFHSVRVLVRPGRHVVDDEIVIDVYTDRVNPIVVQIETMQMIKSTTGPVERAKLELGTVSDFDPSNSILDPKSMFVIKSGHVVLQNMTLVHTSPFGMEYYVCGILIDKWPEALCLSTLLDAAGNFPRSVSNEEAATWDDWSRERLITTGTRTQVSLIGIELTSLSGFGIINSFRGDLNLQKCSIHDCAYAGIYDCAVGSSVTVAESDIVHNGLKTSLGNPGICFCDSGTLKLRDCDVLNNTFADVTMAGERCQLDVEGNDVLAIAEDEVGGTPTRKITLKKRRVDLTPRFTRSGLPVELPRH